MHQSSHHHSRLGLQLAPRKIGRNAKKPCATDCLHFNQELGFGAAWAAHRTQKNIVFVLDAGKSLNAEGERIKTKLSRNMTKHALEESG